MVEPAFPGENVVGVDSNGFKALAIGMVLKQSYNNNNITKYITKFDFKVMMELAHRVHPLYRVKTNFSISKHHADKSMDEIKITCHAPRIYGGVFKQRLRPQTLIDGGN